MAGLYIHIPFCKKRCLYCDFYSTTLLGRQEEYVAALCKEIQQRQGEAGEPIRTIYIGGGTPSTLSLELGTRLNKDIIRDYIGEYTVEVNPGDVTDVILCRNTRRGEQQHNRQQDNAHRRLQIVISSVQN